MSMSMKTKADSVLERAKELSNKAESWAEFSNALFDQTNGLIACTFKDGMERQAFLDSAQYQEIQGIFLSVVKRFGVAEGSAPTKSGRILVRLPKTLHEVLDVEAKREGVSVNQLAVSKLSVPLRESTNLATQQIAEAFAEVHQGFAPDRVVVDPMLDPHFLMACRKRGLHQSDFALNHALFDIRKSGKVALAKTTVATVFHDQGEYQFGAEIAYRVLQRTLGVSLDDMLCNPATAREFDKLCLPLVREQSVLKLRWSALNLRKSRRLSPEDAADGPEYKVLCDSPIKSLDLSRIPHHQATYVFYESNRPIFAGETDNLHDRIGLHLETGRLPLLINPLDPAFKLRYFEVSSARAGERQKWLRQFINREHPLLNYQAQGRSKAA